MENTQTRLERLESRVFDAEGQDFNELPSADIMPAELAIDVTAGADGAFVVLNWANARHDIETYEIWAEGPDGRRNLQTTTRVSPAFFTLSVDSDEGWVFTVRPRAGARSPALEFCPTIGAIIPAPSVGSGDIADGAVQDQHFDRVTANQIAIVDADIVSLTANKLTAGTIDAAIIDVVNLNADEIVTGTLDASVVAVINLVADNIVSGTLSAIAVNGVTITGSSFSLTSGSNVMSITGGSGFQQEDTSSGEGVGILNGAILLFSASGTRFRNQVAGDGIITEFLNTSAFSVVEISTDIRDMGQADSGHLSIRSSAGGDRVELGVEASGDGIIELTNSSGVLEIELIAKGSSNLGNSLVLKNASGANRCTLGVFNSGSQGIINCVGTVSIDIRSGTSGQAGVYVGGNRVVASRQTDPGASPTTDELRNVLLAHGLI